MIFNIFKANGRDKMLLITVNVVKSLFRFLETNEKVSEHYH